MQKTIFIVPIWLLFIFGFKNHTAAGPPNWIDKWKVDETEARSMISYLDSCDADCHDESTTTSLAEDNLDRRIVRELERLGYGNFTFSKVYARYTATQAMKYKKNRNFGNDKGNVKGYKTVLYVITPGVTPSADVSFASFYVASAMYFDVYNICPPPADCRTSRLQ